MNDPRTAGPGVEEVKKERANQILMARMNSRIARLETARRRHSWTTALLLVGLAASLTVNWANTFDPDLVAALIGGREVHARRFVLVDDRGTARGTWQLGEDGSTRLSIHDEEGRPKLNLSVVDGGSPGISLVDGGDRRRVVLGLLPDQTGTLVFADRGGTPRTVLGVSSQGSSSLLFADGEGVSRVSLGLDANGAGNLVLPNSPVEADPPDGPEGGDNPEENR